MKQEIISFNKSNVLDPKFIANCVQAACEFKANVFVKTENKTANVKSLMGMMNFDFENIKSFTLEVEGQDEEIAFNTIKQILV